MSGTMSIGGIASGLKTDDIISKIMEFARQPETQLTNDKALAQSKLAAWQDLNTRVLALKTKCDSISMSDSFNAKSATSSDVSVVTASASAEALEGTYYARVTSRAQSHQLASAQTYTSMSDVVGTGTMRISLGQYGTDELGASTFTEKHDHFDVEIDPNNNTLIGMRDAINRANKGVKAVVVNEGTSETPAYRLLLTSNNTGAEYAIKTDTSGLNGGSAPSMTREIQAATNAVVELGQGEGKIRVSKSTNSFNDLIPGVTLNVAKESPDNTIKIEVTKNTAAIQSSISEFVTQYNDLMDTISSQFKYDSDTGDNGILFGSYQLQMVQADLSSMVSRPIPGLDSKSNTLSAVGITLNSSGQLVMDESKLSDALNADPSAVAKLFSGSVESDSSYISFISNTTDTKPSGDSKYDVVVTQAARRAQVTAAVAMDTTGRGTATLNADETLTINGTNISLKAGMKLSDVVAEINKQSGDIGVSALATGVDGTGDGGYLTLRSTRYGSKYDVSVRSATFDAASNTTGFGKALVSGASAGAGVGLTGLDVEGTIDGQPATGDGQVLKATPTSKDLDTKGLTLLVTSTVPMSSKVRYTKGFGVSMRDMVVGMVSKTGILTQTTDSLNTEITSITDNIASMESRLQMQQDRLYSQFNAMETQLAKLQDQGNYLTSMLSSK